MAVDGAVRATLAPSAGVSRAGMLASVRGVTMSVVRLDDISGDLYASANRIHGDGSMILYDFAVADASRVLLSGRAAIAFGPTSRTPAGERAQP
jgi:predicted hotdog family 3-hydroxylacyl-ACP dehydratase